MALFSPKSVFGFSCLQYIFFFFFTRTSAFSALPKILGMALLSLGLPFPSSLYREITCVDIVTMNNIKIVASFCVGVILFIFVSKCKYHKRYSMTWSFNEHFWLKETRHSSLWHWSRNLIGTLLTTWDPCLLQEDSVRVIMAVYWGWFIMKTNIFCLLILPLCLFHDAMKPQFIIQRLCWHILLFLFLNVGAQQWIREMWGLGRRWVIGC